MYICLRMIKYVLMLMAVAGALGAAVPEDNLHRPEGRIVGGGIATISSFPYLVSILDRGIHRCCGVIIKDTIILTSARCVLNKPLNKLHVRAGSTYWDSVGVVIGIDAVQIHEGFDSRRKQYDIAVLRLSSALPIGYNIRSIPLARADPADGALAVVSGWGETIPGASTRPLTLHYTYVNIIGRYNCRSPKYGYRDEITRDMICAGAPGRDTCSGDGGGPLVVDNLLVGITSWAYGCANAKYPGVYANVPYFRNWILNAAKLVEQV